MEEPSSFVEQITVLVPVPFAVLDAAITFWFASEFLSYNDRGNLRHQWQPTSSGSSWHRMTSYGKPFWNIVLRMLNAESTELNFAILSDDDPSRTDVISRQIAAFWQWFMKEQRAAVELPNIEHIEYTPGATSYADLMAMLPERKRPGPEPAPYNIWAREQTRLGRTIDEILPQYMEQRGEDFNDETVRLKARESLRKTIERGRK
jgi:hypothetical protein